MAGNAVAQPADGRMWVFDGADRKPFEASRPGARRKPAANLRPPLPVRPPDKPAPRAADGPAEQTAASQADLYRQQGRYQEAEPLLRRTVEALERKPGADQHELALALDRLAWIVQALSRYAEAEPLYRKAAAILEGTSGPGHPDTAKVLGHLAALDLDLGRIPEAEQHAVRALAILEKALGPDHADTAQGLDTLGLVYLAQRRYAEADAPLTRALAIREKALGADAQDTANSLARLARLRDRQERYLDAEPLFRRALAIREKTLGPDHPATAISLDGMASVLLHKRAYEEMEPLVLRALAIREKSFGAEHPATLESRDRLASLHMLRRKPDEAEPVIRQTLEIRESKLGPEHPDVAISLDLQASLAAQRGDSKAVTALRRRALAIREKAFGADDIRIADSLVSLAAYAANPKEAEALYQRALAVQTRALGALVPETVETQISRLRLLRRQERVSESRAIAEKLLADLQARGGKDDAPVAAVLDVLAEYYDSAFGFPGSRERPAEAVSLLKRALAIREELLGAENPEVLERLLSLSRVAASVGQIGEAEQFGKRALALAEKAFGPDDVTTAYILARLANFYKEQRQYAEAEPLYRRYVSMSEKLLLENIRTPSFASDLNDMTEVFRAQNKLPEMEEIYVKILAASDSSNKDDDLDRTLYVKMLAEFYSEQNRFSEAEKFYLRYVARQEKALASGDRKVNTYMFTDGLEQIYKKQHRDADLEGLYKREIGVAEKAFGPDAQEVGWILAKLDLFLSNFKGTRDAEREAVLKRILEIQEKQGSGNQQYVVSKLDRLAEFYEDAGRYGEAEPLRKRGLAIMEAAGPEAANAFSLESVARSLSKLAELYKKLDRYADAQPLFERQIAGIEESRGPEHRELIGPLADLAATRSAQGDKAQAEQVLKRAVAIEGKALLAAENVSRRNQAIDALAKFYREEKRDADREALLKARLAVEEQALASKAIQRFSVVSSLDLLYREKGRDADREALLRQVLADLETALGPEDRETVRSVGDLAEFYDRQGRDAEAGTLYERIYRIKEQKLGAEDAETLEAFVSLANSYRQQGRIDEAERAYKQLLAIYERLAAPSPRWFYAYGPAFDGLERLYKGQGRVEEIEPLYRSAAALIEGRALAPAGQNVSETYELAVRFFEEHLRYADALRIARRWLDIEDGRGTPGALLGPLKAAGRLYRRDAQYAEAEPLLKRVVAITEAASGPESEQYSEAIQSLASLYHSQGRYDEAQPLNERAAAIDEAADIKDNSLSRSSGRRTYNTAGRLATSLNALALLRDDQGRYAEAEEAYKRAIDLEDQQWGRMRNGGAIHNLGHLYASLGRYDEAEPLLQRAVQLSEERVGSEHPVTAVRMRTLGDLYLLQGRLPEAEKMLERSYAVSQRVNGPSHPTTLSMLSSLARLRRAQNRHSEAETFLKRAIAGEETFHGPDHPSTISSVQNLLFHYLENDRLADAEALASRLRDTVPKVFRLDDQEMAYNEFLLARLEEKKANWSEAWRLRKDAVAIVVRGLRNQNASELGSLAGRSENGQRFGEGGLVSLVRSAAHLAELEPDRMPALAAETFEALQWARHSQIAAALAQTSARFAKGDGQLAELVRRRQDLISRFKALDGDFLSSLMVDEADTESWERNRARRDGLQREREQMDRTIQEIDATLKVKFPDYAALANPEPLSLAEAQAQLRPGEALYQVAFDTDTAYAWVVTKDAMRWRAIPASQTQVGDTIVALRCGLDVTAWMNDSETAAAAMARGEPAGKDVCRRLTGQDGPGAVLPFDLARAHELYQILFAPFEDLIRGKHILAVLPSMLQSLPLQVLVTEAPDPALKGLERYEKAHWLALRQPVTVLPSVSGLKALRTSARPRARLPYIGFGNPLLTGQDGADRSAWTRKECPAGAPPSRGPADVQQVALADIASPVPRGGLQSFYRGGLGNVALIRQQTPLPETVDELCTVAEALGGRRDDVFLGARASESTLKLLSRQGRLSAARVIHFATHGLIGGETEILTRSRLEPALIMTPPDQASEEDDGLLTASEAAQLDLNADIVILSACNTAAGDGKAGEALSGLARAFLYAGSRALLVSNWYVNSEGAVELVTGMFYEIGKEPGIGEAEALRRTMASRIQSGSLRAHPSYWAPFIIVGEGGADQDVSASALPPR